MFRCLLRTGVVRCMHMARQQGFRQGIGGSAPVHSTRLCNMGWEAVGWSARGCRLLWSALPCSVSGRCRALPPLLLLSRPAMASLPLLVLLLSCWHCSAVFPALVRGGCVHIFSCEAPGALLGQPISWPQLQLPVAGTGDAVTALCVVLQR
jgi:hypothetical protein